MVIEGRLGPEEVVRAAVGMEEKGIRFYSAMAERSKQPETKAVFQRLAEDERKHLAAFSALLDDAWGSWGETADQEREIEAYLGSLIDLQSFGEKDASAVNRPDLTPEDALRYAIHSEKDAIVYYGGAAGYAGNGKAREVFERIAGEERQHLALLTKRLIELGR